MDSLMSFLTGALRYTFPVLAFIILIICVVSLFRNRPRIHKMAQLIDQNNGAIIDIDHWETSIGKSKANDIVLPLPSVSRFHAVIAKKKKDWVITDTFSRTGITVNGKEIDTKAVIENGDVITIGSIPMKFLCAEALSSASKNQIRSDAKTSATSERNVAYGVLVNIKTHRPVYIKQKDVLIGRGDDCDIQITSQAVSAHHAKIHLTSKGLALTDLNSHNGTKLNGRFIDEPQLIFDEDMITFGDVVFIFYEK